MARILIAWEYGAGLGHVSLLVPLAERLKQCGHEPILVLRNVQSTKPVWEGKAIPVMQAPYIPLPATWDKTIQTDTLADVFILAGLADSQKLTALGKAWEQLLAAVKPDIVVTEFSPTLAMVTQGRYPTITVGIAYAVPPAGMPLPAIRFWNRNVGERSKLHEQQVLEAVVSTQKQLGLNPVTFFSDLFGGEEVFVCTYPELDCYAQYRKTPAIGPLVAESVSPPNPNRAPATKAFLYLAYDKQYLLPILEEIKQSAITADAYIRQLEEPIRVNLSSPDFFLYDKPQDLHRLLPERSVLVHHGGIGTSEMGLRTGIPQLVISRHLEQKVNGGLLMRQGVGEICMAHEVEKKGHIAAMLKQIITDNKYRLCAYRKAEDITQRPHDAAMEKVVSACEKWIS